MAVMTEPQRPGEPFKRGEQIRHNGTSCEYPIIKPPMYLYVGKLPGHNNGHIVKNAKTGNLGEVGNNDIANWAKYVRQPVKGELWYRAGDPSGTPRTVRGVIDGVVVYVYGAGELFVKTLDRFTAEYHR